MENVGEISDQQQLVESTASGSTNVGSPGVVSSVVSAASLGAVDNVNTGSEAHVTTQPQTELISPSQASGLSTVTQELTDQSHQLPVDSSTQADTALAVTVANMMEGSVDFRSHHPMGESIYAPMNGRMSPGIYGGASAQSMVNSTYATLTPLQPLPPISTVSEKFAAAAAAASPPNVSGSFTLMQNPGLPGMENSFRYDKLGTNGAMHGSVNMGGSLASSPMPVMPTNGYGSQSQASLGNNITSPYSTPMYNNHTELHSPKLDSKMISPNSYDYRGLAPPTSTRLHSPNPMMPATLNGLHTTHTPSPHSQLSHMSMPGVIRDRQPMSPDSQGGSKHELEEINTKELAQKISSELKRYSIPQAVFAQRVLCRSQGTLSDLLRNPKPWSKLKSGRETFRRMWKWLQEPEFQRMSALRLAGIYCLRLYYILF